MEGIGKYRILIISHEFSFRKGSECAVGWSICNAIAKHENVTVLAATGSQLTQGRTCEYKDAWEEAKEKGISGPGLAVEFVKYPSWARLVIKLNRFLTKHDGTPVGNKILYNIALKGWHNNVYRYCKKNIEAFDIIHQLTPIAFANSGNSWKLGVPFVWGPIGGFFVLPSSFIEKLGLRASIAEHLRNLYIKTCKEYSFHLKQAVRSARKVLVITSNDKLVVDSISTGKSIQMVETSPPFDCEIVERSWDGIRDLNILWSGSGEAIKSFSILIQAIADITIKNRVRIHVLGTAADNKKWRDESKKMGVDERVTWYGSISYHQALAKLHTCDIFFHTSIREGTPHVILEALGSGMPVVCHDCCGMKTVVTDKCGIKIPFNSPEESVLGFRNVIKEIISNNKIIRDLSLGAIERSRELSWSKKALEIDNVYKLYCKVGASYGEK